MPKSSDTLPHGLKPSFRREASAVFRGLEYQLWQTVLAWVQLPEDHALYVETADDFDLAAPDSDTAVQVKDLQSPGRITLRSQCVRDVINHYWEARAENEKRVIYRLLTTASRGQEAKKPFGRHRGLDVWDDVRRRRRSGRRLKRFLQNELQLTSTLRNWLTESTDETFVSELVEGIVWDTKAPLLPTIRKSVEELLVLHGDKYCVPPTDACDAALYLKNRVCDVLLGPHPRRLDRFTFLSDFEQATKISIPISEYLHLRKVAAQTTDPEYGAFKADFARDEPATLSTTFQRVEGSIEIEQRPLKRRPTLTHKPTPLTATHRRLLGLLAVAPWPVHKASLSDLFPEPQWTTVLRYFKKHQLMEMEDGAISVPKEIRRPLLDDAKEKTRLIEEWIAALEKQPRHPVSSLAIFIMTWRIGRYDQGVRELANGALERAEGRPNPKSFLSLFETIERKNTVWRQLEHETRLATWNAHGVMLSRLAENEKALQYFKKVRRYALQWEDKWALGQYFINAGVARFEMGQEGKAIELFEKTIEHAKETKDQYLESSALLDIGVILTANDPVRAEKILRACLDIKTKIHDQLGIVGTLNNLGIALAKQGQHTEAMGYFWRAERQSKKFRAPYYRALARINLGSSSADQGRPKQALKHYRVADRIASAESYSDVKIKTITGRAVVLRRLDDLHGAAEAFKELAALVRPLTDRSLLVQALADAGICTFLDDKKSGGIRLLGQALRAAKAAGQEDWALQCHATASLLHARNDPVSGLVELRKRARREAEKSEHRLAARIWELSGDKAIAFKQIQQGLDDYDQALVQCVQSDNRAHYLLSLYRKVAAYNHWAGRLKRAVDILVEAEKLALDIGDRSARVDVLDDRGIILQNLGRTVEAKQLHKEALDLARSQRYLDGRSRSLNNLAELLRKANNAKEALPLYEESAKVSRLLKDTVGELVSDSNRALALEQLSKVGEAEDLLKRVRDRSRRGEFFEQHVNAISSLANIAWKKGEYRLAARRYSQAIQASTAHRLHENAVTAAVSYSRLETMLGDPEAGLKILEKLSINHPITALLTLKMEIAARLSEVKDVERYFGIAEDVAKLAVLVGNESLADKWLFELAYCECERAGLSANSSIKRVMSSAAREQLTLPGGEILMVLYQGSISQAERLLEKLSEDIGSASDRAELQFMIADYFWKRSARYRYRSLIHYYFALGGDGSKALIDAFSHILQRLASLYPEPGAKTVVYLERKVEGYFKRANIDDSTMRKLMWPFSTVRELKRIPLNTRENAEAVNAIIHRHLLAAFA